MKILAALLSAAGALTLVVWWAISGASWFTLQKVLTHQTVVDDFGDAVTKEVWVDQFVPGLFDLAGPGASGLVVAAVILLWLSRKDLVNPK